MRILFYGESPTHPTGFGQVNKHLLRAISEVAKVTCIATSHYGGYSREEYPYKLYGCLSPEDPRNLEVIKNCIEATEEWDVFFYQGDLGANNDVLEWVNATGKTSIVYMPIDTDFANREAFVPWSWSGIPVCYTHHGRSMVAKYAPELAERMSVIWLGCDVEDFYPLSPEEKKEARREIFGPDYDQRFIVLNVNRNQVRKDLARCISIFHQFHGRHPDSTLYLHSVMQDSGGSLPWQARIIGCDLAKHPAEVAFSSLNLAQPWSRAQLNKLYNACDVFVSTAYGEGWGLATTEAMCAGLPVIVPRNTANLDILGIQDSCEEIAERGFAIDSGLDLDHMVYIYGEHGGMPSKIVHSESLLYLLEYVKSNPELVAGVTDRARQWCLANSWQKREEEWKLLIRELDHVETRQDDRSFSEEKK